MPNKEPPVEHQFTSENQPTKEQIEKAATNRKKNYKLKKWIKEYRHTDLKKLKKIQEDIKKYPENYIADQLIALSVVLAKIPKDYKYYAYERDQEEGKAHQRIVHAGDLTEPIGMIDMSKKEAWEIFLQKIKGNNDY